MGNFPRLSLRISRSCAPLALLAGNGARPGTAPGFDKLSLVTFPAGLRARRCTPVRFPAGRAARGFSCAAGRREAAVSPALVFPRRPHSEAPPSERIIGRGKTHPRSVACAPSLGATARRPFSFIVPPPFRLRQGYGGHSRVLPPKSPRRSLNAPRPRESPCSCGARGLVRHFKRGLF